MTVIPASSMGFITSTRNPRLRYTGQVAWQYRAEPNAMSIGAGASAHNHDWALNSARREVFDLPIVQVGNLVFAEIDRSAVKSMNAAPVDN